MSKEGSFGTFSLILCQCHFPQTKTQNKPYTSTVFLMEKPYGINVCSFSSKAFILFIYVYIMFFHNLNKCVLWCLVLSHNDTEHIFQSKCIWIWLFHHHYDYDSYYNCVAFSIWISFSLCVLYVYNLIWFVQLQVFHSLCELSFPIASSSVSLALVSRFVSLCLSHVFTLCYCLKVFPRW